MIKVDESKCIGCGACVAIDSEHFDFDENGLSKVISQDMTNFSADVIDSCPVGAISIENAEENIETQAEEVTTEQIEESEQIAA
ncbi:MAG TPA: ferredoxin [Candidatus Coprovivens excrementavium]|nr:ferredoxin [Candidatus Coprovivens excrementavium]